MIEERFFLPYENKLLGYHALLRHTLLSVHCSFLTGIHCYISVLLTFLIDWGWMWIAVYWIWWGAHWNAIFVIVISKIIIINENWYLLLGFFVCFRANYACASTNEAVNQFKYYTNFKCHVVKYMCVLLVTWPEQSIAYNLD